MRRGLLTILLLLATGALAGDETPEVVYTDVGAKRILQVRQLTVVYPSSKDPETERFNRVSATARARFLEAALGFEIPVTSDEAITDEQKKGHLFVVGWDNRVLERDGIARPFRRTERGIGLLGIEIPDPSLDVLLCHASPYDETKVFYFWSRIVPELDRFLVVPTLASDWVVYREYLPIRQGMFRPEPGWPPVRNPDAEKDHQKDLDAIREKFRVEPTPHYDIHYDPEVVSDSELRAIVRSREDAFGTATRLVGEVPDRFRVDLYVYNDVAQKMTLTHVEDPAHSLPGEIHAIRRIARSETAHEDFHVVARELFGPAALTGLYEGLAVAGDGSYRNLSIDVHAAKLVDEGRLPTLATLLNEETLRRLPPPVMLPSSALMVTWMRESFGESAFRRAYGVQEGSVEALAAALRKPSDELESGFRSWVEGIARTKDKDVAFLKAEAEARENQLVGDFEGVARALVKALRYRPNDPQTLFNLASAQMRTEAYSEAETNLKKLLTLPLGPRVAHLEIFGHYQLGRLYDIQGRREDALARYRRVLALPDRHGAHQLAREAIEVPVTREQLE